MATPLARAAWRAERPWLDDVAVCDGLFPWAAGFLPPGARLVDQLRRFQAAGVDHVSVSAAAGREGAGETLTRLGLLRRELAEAPDIVVARGAEAIDDARRAGRFSVAFHAQTATPFADGLDLVEGFHAAGVDRAILAYNEANVFADGCHEPRNAGITAFGRRLIERMDAVGMVVDLSHCGERTAFEALDAPLKRPPIFSHSNARVLFDHERNISDDLIRAAAKRGSYIGVNGVGMFLGADSATLPKTIARHLAHIADIIGAERVGLCLDFMFLQGSDYGFFHAARGRWPRGYPDPPWDFLQPEQIGDLVVEIERVGFGRSEVAGILGGNYLHLVA